MKKVLSILLAALMFLSCMSISAFAEDFPFFGPNGADANEDAVLKFVLNNGTVKSGQYIYDRSTGKLNWTDPEDVPDTFYVVPIDNYDGMFEVGDYVTLPSVKGPKGWQFVGWQRNSGLQADADRSIYPAGPNQYQIKEADRGMVVEFSAVYEQAEVEEDTFAKVFDILIKVFGTIIGLIAYNGNIQKGQDFMAKIFSSLG